MVDVSLIVVNYHTPNLLDEFIRSVFNHLPNSSFEVIVADVEAISPPSYCVQTFLDTGMITHYLPFRHNVGYATACNIAAVQAKGKILAFFNADTAFTDNLCIDYCVDFLNNNDNAAIVGPMQVNEKGQLTHAGITGTNSSPVLRGWLSSNLGDYGTDEQMVSVSGSAYFIKVAVWDEMADCPLFRNVAPECAGAFLPTQHYWEETYLSYHTRFHGYEIYYLGGAKMIHHWHKASPVGSATETQILPESRKYFREACSKHGIECD